MKVDFRAMVLGELERREWSVRRLVLALKGRVPERTIYSWLNEGRDLGATKLACVLEVLGIAVGRKKRRSPQRARRAQRKDRATRQQPNR